MIEIIADSINPDGQRLTTFLIHRMPKQLLAEFNTHRMLSRNAASSRAIPVAKIIEQVETDPFIYTMTAAQRGMGGEIITDSEKLKNLRAEWLLARGAMVHRAKEMHSLGASKEVINRLLEPFLTVPVIVTASTYENFFALRCDESAQADLRNIACLMRQQYKNHQPAKLKWGEWHIPFLDGAKSGFLDELEVSVSKCAAISYSKHAKNESLDRHTTRAKRLKTMGHLSPFEHQARARKGKHANFTGWQSYRNLMETTR